MHSGKGEETRVYQRNRRKEDQGSWSKKVRSSKWKENPAIKDILLWVSPLFSHLAFSSNYFVAGNTDSLSFFPHKHIWTLQNIFQFKVRHLKSQSFLFSPHLGQGRKWQSFTTALHFPLWKILCSGAESLASEEKGVLPLPEALGWGWGKKADCYFEFYK